jgi:UrcA family protein
MIRSTMGTVDLVPSMGDGGQGDRELRSRKGRVRCEDLNLSRKDDVKVLYQRIRAAAASVCSPLAHTHRLAMHRKWVDCRAIEISRAVAEIDDPRLTEFHIQLASHVLEGA